jgi:hypothetical protein
MRTSNVQGTPVGSSLQALSSSRRSTHPRRRFAIRGDGGFLAASHAIDGPPIRLVRDALEASRFIDVLSACRRARAFTELGWRNLRVVEFLLP